MSEKATTNWRLGFWSLIVTQFQGAFNDNALKFLVIYLIVEQSFASDVRDQLVLLVGALFALPYILFSLAGGFLADRYSKRSVTIGTKFFEIGVMIFALISLTLRNFPMEAAAVFLISTQGALFGPSKYGLLPELLPERELSWGNGVIELGTFVAAITATMAAGFLADAFRGRQFWSGTIFLGFTLFGVVTSLGISRVPAADPSRRFPANPFADLGTQVRLIAKDRVLSWSVVGNTYLWFLAALLQFTIVIYGHDILRIDERHISYLQAAVAIGIGLGSLATGYLSDAKIEYGLIPVGAVGMTVFGFLSASQGISLERAAVYLGLVGFFGGFYAVPLNALIQHRPDPARKGGIIAAANLISFVGVFAAAGVYFALAEGFRLHADQIFFAGACMTLAATFYAVVFLPDSVLRLALWILTHSVYRIRVEGRDNIPERGGALFVVNDLTLLDAIFLAAATDRPMRFVADANPFARTAPLICRALRITHVTEGDWAGFSRAVSTAFASGEVVCVAGEPASTLLEAPELRYRLERYLRETGAPVVLVTVSGAENGPLRSEDGRLRLMASHPRGQVRIKFCAPTLPFENFALAEALRFSKSGPAFGLSPSSR